MDESEVVRPRDARDYHAELKRAAESVSDDLIRPLREIERAAILAAIEHVRGDKRRAAKALGISLSTLYNKLSEYGTVVEPPEPTRLSSPVRYPKHGKYAELVLVASDEVVLIDVEDADWLSRYRWYAQGESRRHRYAVRKEGGANVLMHRQITGAPDGMDVDHLNGDTLDDRRSNLRVCTRSENLLNNWKARA